MKKITLLIMFFVSTLCVKAQVAAYQFTQSTGTYTEITGGTALGAETSDDQRFVDPAVPLGGFTATGVGFPIGFNFVFNGVVYDRFAVNANGWISFGMSSLGAAAVNNNSNSAYTPIGSTVTSVSDDLVARISGLGRDLGAQVGGSLRFEVLGTSPNQTLVIQWKNYRKYNATGDTFNFQIRLHETTNVVDVVYGSFVCNATTSNFESGLRAAPAASAVNFSSRTSATSWTATTSAAAATNAITMVNGNVPSDGLTFTWTPPTCPGSVGLTTSALTNSSATVTWPIPNPAPSTGYEYVVSTSNLTPVTNGTSTLDNFANVSGLTGNTVYYVFVRSNCGSSFGTWVLNGSFKTLCNSVTDYVMSFEGYPTGTAFLPDCWSKGASTGNVYNTTGSVAPMSPTNRLYMNISTTTNAYAILPPVSNLQAETHRLKFKAYATSASKILNVGYLTDAADVNSFQLLDIYNMPSTAATTAQEFILIPTSIPAGVTNLAFKLESGTSTTIYIDDVKWEVNSTCVEPSALTVNTLTNTSVNLVWTNGGSETQWEAQYGPTNFALGTGTLVSNITTNPYSLTGLTANTTYQYYVRAVCSGPINSAWAGPFSFTTQCNDNTFVNENFDALTVSGSTTMPDCWRVAGNGTAYTTTGATAPFSPSNRLYMFASSTAVPATRSYVILPALSNLQANTHRLKFRAYTTAAGRTVDVGYLTDPSNISSFVSIQVVTLPGTVIANAQDFVVTPVGGSIPAGVKNLVFQNPGFTGGTSTIYIDNVLWEPIPACSNPTAPSASAVTSNTASIAWTGNATDVSWEIEYGVTGFTLGTGTIVPAGTNPFTLTSLTPTTVYQFYIRSICAGPLTSTSSFAGTFTTLCAPFTPDYTQDFATFPPVCWSRADAGALATGPTGTGAGFWAADGFLNVGSAGAIKVNLFISNRIGWMVSPVFNLSAGGYQVKYDVGATVYASTTPATMGSDDKVDFAMSTDGGVSWTSLELYNTANTPTNISSTKVYSIPAVTSSNVLFAFRADEGPVDDSQDWEFFVDNFKIDIPATTVPACATNVVASQGAGCGNYPLTITWNASASTNGYKINVGTTVGGTDIANNVNLGTTLTYTLNAPTTSTTYYYTIIPYNAVGDAVGCVEQSFATPSTPCACIPPYTTGVGFSDYFSSFALQGTTLNNNSGTSTTAASYNYYSGLPNYTATLDGGTTYAANVTVGYSDQAFSVWIDFNDNAIFETSERVGSTGTNVNTPGGSFNITIPCDAVAGFHKMRVRMIYAATGNTIDPCASASFGETEDYNVTIAPVAAPSGTANQSVCGSGTLANLVVTGTAIKWYDAATLGTELPTTTALTSATTYYASQTISSCESATRLAVTVTVNPIPATPTGSAAQTYCSTDNDDLLDLVVTGSGLIWYDAATAGNVLPNTTLLTATTYYVASNNGSCESPRLAISTTEDCSPSPCLTAVNGQWPSSTFTPNSANCDGFTSQSITTCGFASEYSVVAVITGQTYTFSSSVSTDVITISADGGATSVATGIGSATWVATISGNIRFYTHLDGCASQSACRTKTVTCGIISTDLPDYVNLQSPSSLTFAQGASGTVYGQVYESGLTDVAPNITGQAPGITAWVGISPIGSNTNPNTWTNWVASTWNSGHVSNNDEYQSTIGATLLPGTYYYATRFRLNSGAYVYGGIDSSNNGNFWNGTVYNSGVLTITPPPAPANDDCSGAYTVTVNTDLNCTSVTAGSLIGATASTTDATACGGTEDDDVWFSFVATATIHRVSMVNIAGGTTDLYHSLWTGADCSSLTLVPNTCSDPNVSTPTGLTIGQTYFIRVYSWTSTAGQTSTFNVCIGTLPPPPANDNCSGAVALTAGGVFADFAVTGSNASASNSNPPAPGCASFNGGDVWYSVTIPASGNLTIETGTGSLFDTGMAVYSGSCTALTLVDCDDDSGSIGNYSLVALTGRTPGEVLYVNVWDYLNDQEGTFQVSAYDASLGNTSFDNANFSYYPNPVKNMLNLSYTQNISSVAVFNLLGQEVVTRVVNENQSQIDMSHLPTGTYLVKVTADNQVKTIKVIKE